MDAFDQLQQKLAGMWEDIGSTVNAPEAKPRTIVVVPSLSGVGSIPTAAQQMYEERLLFMLFLLHKPGVNMIYVTAKPIAPAIVDYYLGLLPGMIASSARQRLFLVSPEDGSSVALSRKLLDRPRLIAHIRGLIADPERAHLVPFNTTDMERELAVQLGIPMYAADPSFFAFGTKSGSRQVFAEEGLQHPLGFENLHSVDELVSAIASIRRQRPALKRVVVKLNEGASGHANALVLLAGLPPSGDPAEAQAIRSRVEQMKFEFSGIVFADYAAQLAEIGGIVEEFLEGLEIRSPSAQMRATPTGEVELLSTHDQMLGGPSGQAYLGAIFPADPAYSTTIAREALKVGRRFAREGIVGRFALDFVVVKNEDGSWDSYAIEVNLRKGGTTAPYLILQYLTDGQFDAESGRFETSQGKVKFYTASDHIESEAYRIFTIQDLFNIVSNHGLHYNHATQTGLVLHIISGVGELGRVGATAIHNTPQEAYALYEQFQTVLDQEARR